MLQRTPICQQPLLAMLRALPCVALLVGSAAAAVQPAPIVIADDAAGLRLISAPSSVSLPVGHIVYLGVQVEGGQRPVAIGARPLIHTFVNGVTQAAPAATAWLPVGTIEGSGELELQTLRMRPHLLVLELTAGDETVGVEMELVPYAVARTPLFGAGYVAGAGDRVPDPFVTVEGPDCSPCATSAGDPPGTTRDHWCAKRLHHTDGGQCRCHTVDAVLDPAKEARARQVGNDLQRYASQLLRSLESWTNVQTAPDTYLWKRLDWLFALPPEQRDYLPLYSDIMHGDGGWFTCPEYGYQDSAGVNHIGFYTLDNDLLWDQYRAFVFNLASHNRTELRFFETHNEPTYGFYLCPCTDPTLHEPPPCDSNWGPNQDVCPLTQYSDEFAATYGDFLLRSAVVAAEALAAANPDALLVASALEQSGKGMSATTERMIRGGLLDTGNVALMIHQFPYPPPDEIDWVSITEPCAYFGFFQLPDGCETPPPLDDYIDTHGKLRAAREKWIHVDRMLDSTRILTPAERLGVADRLYLLDTELHAGFFVKDTTTTAGRAAIAGLRAGAINAHQRYVGLNFIGTNTIDPAPYNTLVRALSGASPVYRWQAQLTGTDYSDLVYKLFTRGSEDILVAWSNAAGPKRLLLDVVRGGAAFRTVRTTSLVAAPDDGGQCGTVACAELREPIVITQQSLDGPPSSISVVPLRQVVILSVVSDLPDFGWLDNLSVISEGCQPRRMLRRVREP